MGIPHYTKLLRFSYILFAIFLISGSVITFFTASSAHAAPTLPGTVRPGNVTILLVHGFNGDSSGSSAGFNCTDNNNYGWGTVLNYLGQSHDINGQSLRWNRQDFRTIQFYGNDTNCDANLHDSNYASHCSGYVSGNEGNNNESLYHLSCLFAWYLYDKFGKYGYSVEIVAHSMGGLIVRNTIYQVQNHKSSYMPPTIGGISDVVTFATPHGGIPGGGGIFTCGSCTQIKDMTSGSQFMNEMYNSAQNPQATSGTDWTLMGDNGSIGHRIRCDSSVPPGSATYMYGGRKSVFNNLCYSHAGYLTDTNDAYNGDIYWCDGCGLPPNYFSSWNRNTTAPHSLHHMMYALWLSTW